MNGAGAERPSRSVTICLALVAVVFTTVFPYLAAVNNPNENVRTYMTMAIVEDHTFRIDRMVARHGYINDMAKVPDKKTGEEHLYSVKGPAVSYFGVPVYWLFENVSTRVFHRPPPSVDASSEARANWLRDTTFVLRLFTLQIPCFLFLVWFERFLRSVTSDVVLRMSAVIAAGVGTNYLAYAMMFVSHAAFACAAFGSFAVITRERMLHPDDARGRRISRAFLAGLLAGLATLLEYHGVVVSAALGLYALVTFYRPTRLAAFAVGAGIDVGALMFFQWKAYGDPFMPGHRMLENASYKAYHLKGLFGVEGPNADHVKELIFSPTFGFFGTSPFMWLAVLAVPVVLLAPFGSKPLRTQQRIAALFMALAMTLLWLTVSGAIVWRGGWTIGPRLIGAAPPFFACAAAYGLERIARRSQRSRIVARGLAGGLACASVVQTGFVSLMYNTLPEELVRPLPDFAIPFARAGYAPHHLAEVLGFPSVAFFHVVLACLALAALVAALSPAGDRPPQWLARLGLATAALCIGLLPAFSAPSKIDEGDRGLSVRKTFAAIWEPTEHDRLLLLRTLAEAHGREQPCLWHRVANLERVLGFEQEALGDDARSTVPARDCF